MIKDLNYYDIVGDGKINNGEVYTWKDLCELRDVSSENLFNNLKKYKSISDLSSQYGKKILEDLFSCMGVKVNFNDLKGVVSIGSNIRKTIKDYNKNLLEIIDSPDFLNSYIYLLLGFNFGNTNINGRNSLNPSEALAKTIIQLIEKDHIEISSFLCAHRENKYIEKRQLVHHINNYEVKRMINLIEGIVKNLGSSYHLNIFHTNGNKECMNAVFPQLFLEYFKNNELGKMSNLLDQHFEEMKNFETEEISIISVSEHFKETIYFLEEKYGTQWKDITLQELFKKSESDKFLEVVYYMTIEDMKRFESSFNKFHKDYKQDEINKMIDKNIKNTKNKKNEVENAIKIFFDKLSLPAKALYETAFYYLRGKKTFKNEGIALGFDRDHDLFQSSAFSIGYDNINSNNIPLLYAKRTGKKSENTIKGLSFRQFWHYYE